MTAVISRSLEFGIPRGSLWQLMTDPEQLRRWFPDDARLERYVGGEGWFEWASHGRFAVRIEYYEPPARISWRWARDPGLALDAGPSTLVEWVLSPTLQGGTLLELTESGFERDEDREENERGWTAELAQLGELIASEDPGELEEASEDPGETQKIPTLQRARAICRHCDSPIETEATTCPRCGAYVPA